MHTAKKSSLPTEKHGVAYRERERERETQEYKRFLDDVAITKVKKYSMDTWYKAVIFPLSLLLLPISYFQQVS